MSSPGIPTPPHGYDLWSWVVDPIVGGERDERNTAERALWQAYVVDYEVGNGGFHQVHGNLEQEFIDSAAQGLRDLGAERHANLIAEATGLVADMPLDGNGRRAAMETIASERFNALDDAWYAGEPLAEVLERYIRSHADLFFE
jgi:hypothetical protein